MNLVPAKTILAIRDLVVDFDHGKPTAHRALDSASFEVAEGEVVGLVGESGSGKTVLAHTILGLLPGNGTVESGSISWEGRNLIGLNDSDYRSIRGRRIAMIFQDAQASLNPVLSVASQMTYLLKLHRGMNKAEAAAEALRLLELVHLSEPARVLRSYAHQLSGGMCQRVMIAMALACRPKLLIADEPTSALDVTIQAEIVRLLQELRLTFGMAMLFVTHDLGVASHLCDRVVVMRAGKVVEQGSVSEIFTSPSQPYTRRLLESIFVPMACRTSSATFFPKD